MNSSHGPTTSPLFFFFSSFFPFNPVFAHTHITSELFPIPESFFFFVLPAITQAPYREEIKRNYISARKMKEIKSTAVSDTLVPDQLFIFSLLFCSFNLLLYLGR